MAISSGRRLGKAICEAVGIDSTKVPRIDLSIIAGHEEAILTVRLFLTPEQEAAIVRLFVLTEWREDRA